MHEKRVLLALSLTLLPAALTACLRGSGPPEREATSIVLPEGDPEAGRRAFTSLGCALCHQAAGDRGMPAPASTTPGPAIGPAQAGQSTDLLVESILSPSHRLPDSLEVSPMADYSDITIRQLSDVVAYIRYMAE